MGGEVEGAIGGSKHSSLERWEWAELSANYTPKIPSKLSFEGLRDQGSLNKRTWDPYMA